MRLETSSNDRDKCLVIVDRLLRLRFAVYISYTYTYHSHNVIR